MKVPFFAGFPPPPPGGRRRHMTTRVLSQYPPLPHPGIAYRSEGFPGTGYVTPGCGGRGGRVWAVQSSSCAAAAAACGFWQFCRCRPPPQEVIENKKNFPYGPFGGNFPNPDLAEKSSFPNGKSKHDFLAPGDWLILSRVYVIRSCASLQLGFPLKILYG